MWNALAADVKYHLTYLHRLGHHRQRQFRGPQNRWGSLLQALQGWSFAAYQEQGHHCLKQHHQHSPLVPLQHRQEHHLKGRHSLLQHHLRGQHSLLLLLPGGLCEQRVCLLGAQHVHGVQLLNLHGHAVRQQRLLQQMLKLSMKIISINQKITGFWLDMKQVWSYFISARTAQLKVFIANYRGLGNPGTQSSAFLPPASLKGCPKNVQFDIFILKNPIGASNLGEFPSWCVPKYLD